MIGSIKIAISIGESTEYVELDRKTDLHIIQENFDLNYNIDDDNEDIFVTLSFSDFACNVTQNTEHKEKIELFDYVYYDDKSWSDARINKTVKQYNLVNINSIVFKVFRNDTETDEIVTMKIDITSNSVLQAMKDVYDEENETKGKKILLENTNDIIDNIEHQNEKDEVIGYKISEMFDNQRDKNIQHIIQQLDEQFRKNHTISSLDQTVDEFLNELKDTGRYYMEDQNIPDILNSTLNTIDQSNENIQRNREKIKDKLKNCEGLTDAISTIEQDDDLMKRDLVDPVSDRNTTVKTLLMFMSKEHVNNYSSRIISGQISRFTLDDDEFQSIILTLVLTEICKQSRYKKAVVHHLKNNGTWKKKFDLKLYSETESLTVKNFIDEIEQGSTDNIPTECGLRPAVQELK